MGPRSINHGFDDIPLTRFEYEWVMQGAGTRSNPPPGTLVIRRLAEQLDDELFFPPFWQLTKRGNELRQALAVRDGLRTERRRSKTRKKTC